MALVSRRKKRSRPSSLAALQYWPLWALLSVLWLVNQLPFRWQLALGRRLGRGVFHVANMRREVALRNLALCMPELSPRARLRLARAHFESLGMGLVELGMSWWTPLARLRKRLRVEGLEHLERARATGRGVLLVSAHFTSMDISGRLFAPRISPVHVVYRRHENPVIDHLMRRARERNFTGAIPRDGMRSLIRTLRRKGVVWYAADQAYRGKYSALVPFFGVPAPTNTATSRIARMADAVVVPLFMERDAAAGLYTVRLLPPLEAFPSDNPVADAKRIHARVETQIRRCPEQYFWVHKRFKRRSPDEPDVYGGSVSL